MGADPEFLFAKLVDGMPMVTPAKTILGSKELTTFIGTDNHPATAEFRPHPAHDIYRVMHQLAAGIDQTQSWLDRKRKWSGHTIIAQPWLPSPEGHGNQDGEHLGGHIHTSMFVEDPDLREVYEANMTFNGQPMVWDENKSSIPLKEELGRRLYDRYQKRDLFSPFYYAQTINYLLVPFDRWLQNWTLRAKRNTHYGLGAGDTVRVNVSHPSPAMAERFKTSAYLHYEYRLPCTWLVHPWMAYAYFALVKVIMTNWNLIWDAAAISKDSEYNLIEAYPGSNDKYLAMFQERWAKVFEKLSFPTDTQDLGHAIEMLGSHREKWVQMNQPIIVNAWRQLL